MIINGIEYFLGCDPEVFVVDDNGDPVPAHGLIPGTKENPLLVKDGMVQVDGLALEFGIDPCSTKQEFVQKIKSVLKQLKAMLPPNRHLHFEPVVQFKQKDLSSLPEEALELGCDPDYSAYTLKANPRPVLPFPAMRSAGGHVHIGWGVAFDTVDRRHIEACAALASALDFYLGVPSLTWDRDILRRAIYGAPGAFRPKRYGMEYRSLSNQWLIKEETIEFVYDSTVAALRSLVDDSALLNKKLSFYSGNILLTPEEIINNNVTAVGASFYSKLLRGEAVV